MIEGKFEAILNRKVDGEISTAEAEELKEYLAGNPEAQSYAEDLDGLCRMLREVKEIDPPHDLKDEILARVRQASAPTVHKATLDLEEDDGWFAVLVETVRGWMRPQLAYGFVAGAAAGVLLLSVFTDSTRFGIDESSLPGAMMPVESTAFSSIDTAQLQLDGTRMGLETKRHEDRLLGEIHVESAQPVQIVLEFDGASVSPVGFWRRESSNARIEVGAGRIQIAHQGANTYQVLLTDGPASAGELTVRLHAEDEVTEQKLRTRP